MTPAYTARMSSVTGAPEPSDAASALADAVEAFVTAVGLAADPHTVTIAITADGAERTITAAAGDADWLAEYVNAAAADVTRQLEHPDDDAAFDVWGR